MHLLAESVWTWSHFLFGITYALVASLIFIFLLLIFLKPRIKICPFLCRVNIGGHTFYIFKFVNHSFFSAHEIKAELYKIRKIPMGGGEFNNEHDKLTIVKGDISHVPNRPFFWQKNISHPHCIVVRSFDDINTILGDDLSAVLLRVSLKHGLTGLSKVFEQEYGNEGDVRNARFKPGTKFESV